jgi:hypothetical protein
VLAKNEIPTLANIVIIDQMHVDLHNPSFCTIQGFVASGIAQAKEMSYHNQHPIDKFLPLTIDVFGCLLKQANVFLHNCANAIWSFKGPKGPPFSILVTFICQRISITSQRMQTSSILNQAMIIGLTTSQLPPL